MVDKKESKNNKKYFKLLFFLVIIFFIIGLISTVFYFIFETKYENKIYPGINVSNIDLSGYNIKDAKKLLYRKINKLNQSGIKFEYPNRLIENYNLITSTTDQILNKSDQEIILMPIISSFSGDIAREIITFDVDVAIVKAFRIGREKNFYDNFLEKIKTLIFKKTIQIDYNLYEEEIVDFLKKSSQKFEILAQDATLIATTTSDKKNIFHIKEEKAGRIIDYKKAIADLKINLTEISNQNIKLATEIYYPKIYKKYCLDIVEEAKKIIDLNTFVFNYTADTSKNNIYTKKEWKVNKTELASWLALQRKDDEISIKLDQKKIAKFIENKISPDVDQDPIDARFEIEVDKVTEFQDSKNGLKINITKTMLELKKEFNQKNKTSKKITKNVNIITEEVQSKISTNNINDLGIKEIIGTGHSSFAGSPQNRRHNIKIGSEVLHGLLLKPGEEFSMNKSLGEIDGKAGYLPELVIKDNKTIPEYGGGLCQVGTTMFRTALQSGLLISLRRSHSYRVSYYEPAGTDATIYSPWPDFRFINDTESYILIQTRMEGDDLYYDFWGTKDKRKIKITEPTIYNIVKPEPTKIVKTTELKPGEKKCVEQAHNGADAYFDYEITYDTYRASTTESEKFKEYFSFNEDGKIVKKRRFQSHYIPWQAVCLVGEEEVEEEIIKEEVIKEEDEEDVENVLEEEVKILNSKRVESL